MNRIYYERISKKSFWLTVCFFLVLFSVIIGRLFFLMVVEGDNLAAKATGQRSRSLSYNQFERGDFLDTLGRKLTGAESSCLVMFPTMAKDGDIDADAQQLADCLQVSSSLMKGKIKNSINQSSEPVIIKTNLSENNLAALKDQLPYGFFVLPLAARYDSYWTACHIIGQVGLGESAGEYQGLSGLEKQYDRYLQNRNGSQVAALVDEKGQQISGYGFHLLESKTTSKAANIRLTINADYQRIAERAISGQSGAAVVLDVNSGDILAICSEPQIDPYAWEEPATNDAFVNKAFALYPPASTFKIVLATAACEEKVALPEDFVCDGAYELPDGQVVNCWKTDGHGPIDLSHALANSCNSYFVNLGLLLGGDTIKKYSKKFGLTQQNVTGYTLNQETYIDFNNNVPGDLANASIGEKGIRLSPLMVCSLTAAIANGGKRVHPRLVKEIDDQDGNIITTIENIQPEQVISQDTAKQVADMMLLAVQDGTATRVKDTILESAGKTGTSQDKGIWFTGFAPVENPKFAITVYLEEGNAGGTECAAIYKQILDDIAVLENMQ